MGLGLAKVVPFIIYGFSAIFLFLTIFKHPRYGIFFLFPLLPYQNIFEKIKTLSFGNNINDILIFAILLGWIFKIKVNENNDRNLDNRITERNGLFASMVFFIAINFIGLIYIAGFGCLFDRESLYFVDWKNYMILPLIWFLTFQVIKDKKNLRILTILLVLGFLGALYCFWREIRYMSLSSFSEDRRDRLAGLFVYLGANYYGAFFAHFGIMTLGIFLFEKIKKFKMLLLFIVIFTVYCLLFTFSRGAYLGFTAGLLFLGLVKEKKILVIIAIVFIFWQTLVPKGVIERITMTKDSSGNFENSAATRIKLWDLAWGMFKSSPIIGNGFESFQGLGFVDTHNFYMKMLAELGLLGLFSFIWLLFASFMTGWSLYRESTDVFFKGLGLGFAGCVVAVAVTNAFGNRWAYISVGSYFWIFLGIVTRANFINQSEKLKLNNSHKKNHV